MFVFAVATRRPTAAELERKRKNSADHRQRVAEGELRVWAWGHPSDLAEWLILCGELERGDELNREKIQAAFQRQIKKLIEA